MAGSDAKRVLSERERRFVDAFMGKAAGNATKAACLAGYSKTSARRIGTRLSSKDYIQQAIAQRRAGLEARGITNAHQRREILTSIENDVKAHPLARIKAIDVHNKMDGIYVERRELTGPNGGPIQVTAIDMSRLTEAEIRAARAISAKAAIGENVKETINPVPGGDRS